jgi:hypothetical protein
MLRWRRKRRSRDKLGGMGVSLGIARGRSGKTVQSSLWMVGSLALETRRQRRRVKRMCRMGKAQSLRRRKGASRACFTTMKNRRLEVQDENYTPIFLLLFMALIK